MGSIPITKAAGLYTSSNELGSVPDGAMTEAKNVVIRSKDLVEPRRGFRNANTAGAFTAAVRSLHSYNGSVYAVGGSGSLPNGTIAQFNGIASLTALATAFNAPDSSNIRAKSFEAQNCLYLTSSEGVRKIDSTSSDHKQAGVPKPLSINGATTSSATGFLPVSAGSVVPSVAYVYVFGTRDAQGRTILGEPSARWVYSNVSTANKANVLLQFRLPSDVTTNHFIQVYRTKTANTSAALTGDYYQVYEADITAAAISSKVFPTSGTFITDKSPDGFLSRLGYFSSNAESLAEANNEPPLCTDATLYGNTALYANTTLRHGFTLDILGVDPPPATGSGGVKADDTFTIDGLVYTAHVLQDPALRQFAISTLGGYDGILDTARNLIACINQNSSSNLYAYSIAEETGSPGAIYIERRSLSGASFTVSGASVTGGVSSAQNYTSPSFTTTAVLPSSNEPGPNRIYWSKRDIPEAVPRVQYVTVGAKNKKILRIVVLRDRVFIFKEDGIFALSGQMETCRVYPLDPTVICVAPDSVAAVNNEIYALTNKGVVKVSDAGVQIVSKGIERALARDINLLASSTVIKTGTWGCGYETENLYLLGIATESAYAASRVYCYNTASPAWTWWDLQPTCALVDPSKNYLYLGGEANENLRAENKSLTNLDYSDGAGSQLEFAAAADQGDGTFQINFDIQPSVGDWLFAIDGSAVGYVTSLVSTNDAIVRLVDGTFTSSGFFYRYQPFECVVEWASKAPAGTDKDASIREAELCFRDAYFYDAYFGVSTDGVLLEGHPEYRREVISPDGGHVAEGSRDWGQSTLPSNIRVSVHKDVSRGRFFRARFEINEANAMWGIQGVTLLGDATSERGGK